MLFYSLEFIILFLGVLPFAYSNNSTVRRLVMLIASYLFYMWFSVSLVGLLIFSSCLDFYIGKKLHQTSDLKQRKQLLIISLVGNLGMLFFFKYFNFFLGNMNGICHLITGKDPFLFYNIILPLGISFYTFQTLSYTIDIYRKKLEPTQSLLTFALYVSFFPQLVAGPIVRASFLIPQLEKGPVVKKDQIRRGIGLFVFGLIKKIVIADNLSLIADQVFVQPGLFGGLDVLFGVYAFAIQIYCDFSGYTDMARGVGFLLGYDVGLNFNFPYFATGIRDFWRRWHISLSTWLRDYLYISLGGNRGGLNRHLRNIMITMLLGGLWHGANWTFVVWGGIHGGWICLEHIYGTKREQLCSVWIKLIQTIFTFHMVCITWIFFRAENLSKAIHMFQQLFNRNIAPQLGYKIFLYIIPLFVVDMLWVKTKITRYLMQSRLLFWIAIWLGIFIYILFGNFQGDEFVYFQF